jgi:hypothetical protein
MVLGDNMRRGLNVVVNNGEARLIQSPSPNRSGSGSKMINVVRPKSISSEKIFLTIRKWGKGFLNKGLIKGGNLRVKKV